VIEATSLQGQIGRLMYEREGGDASVATAIEEHYKPQGPSDAVPTDPVAIAVALADKLDTLVGFWAINEKPTGSKDPFALRRAALGVIRVVLERDVEFDVQRWVYSPAGLFKMHNPEGFDELVEEFGKQGELRRQGKLDDATWQELKSEYADVIHKRHDLFQGADLEEFIYQRLRVYLRDNGFKHDVIDAVLSEPPELLGAASKRVETLQAFLETPDGENLLAGYKRAGNILKAEAKKGELPSGEANRPSDEHGAALFEALNSAKPEILEAVGQEDYSKALTSLASLRKPIDDFFTHTQIISDDSAVRENNLRLLGMISDTARHLLLRKWRSLSRRYGCSNPNGHCAY